MTLLRFIFCSIAAALLANSSVAAAANVRVGLLVVAERAEPVAAFREALRSVGYREGRNLTIEYRSADGDVGKLPALVRSLLASKVDILVTHSTPAIRAAKSATSKIPIVMASVGNAVERGFVASMARPGGNITGLSFFGAEMAVKRVGILKELLPSMTRMALLVHPSYPEGALRQAIAAVGSLKMIAQVYRARGPEDFEAAFEAMKRQRADGLQILASPVLGAHRDLLAGLALKHRLAAIFPWGEAVPSGGLIAYGPDHTALFRRAAVFVDRIAKGADPAILPVERATQFDLAVNVNTAKKIGVRVPPSILLRATDVIE